MEKFLNLSVEKQNKIIDAAFTCFGAYGYKRAAISDIATTAGISKALIFYYFDTKNFVFIFDRIEWQYSYV